MVVCHPEFYFSSFILPRDPKKGSGPTNLWTEPSLASLLTVSFPRTPACPGTQYSQPHGVSCRHIVQHLLALSYQCWFLTLCIVWLGWFCQINRIFFFVNAGRSSLFISVVCHTFVFGDLSFNHICKTKIDPHYICVLTAVFVKCQVSCDVMLFRWVNYFLTFGRMDCLKR